MGQKGIVVMLKWLKGNRETVDALQASIGKTITNLEMKEDVLYLTFSDGKTIKVWDDGQSCCETRHMMTDDKLSEFIGSTLTGMELREAPNQPTEEGEHEVQFLLVNTSLGTFTMATHNEHNGYYGGFAIEIREVE